MFHINQFDQVLHVNQLYQAVKVSKICPKKGWGVPNLQTSSVQKLIPQIGKRGGVTPLWTDSAKNVF